MDFRLPSSSLPNAARNLQSLRQNAAKPGMDGLASALKAGLDAAGDLQNTAKQAAKSVSGGQGVASLPTRAVGSVGGAGNNGGFSVALKGALQAVSAAQNESTALQKEVQLDNPKVSLEETMVAMQKAQIGFQAAVHVRNKMVQAYTDIMNMQV